MKVCPKNIPELMVCCGQKLIDTSLAFTEKKPFINGGRDEKLKSVVVDGPAISNINAVWPPIRAKSILLTESIPDHFLPDFDRSHELVHGRRTTT